VLEQPLQQQMMMVMMPCGPHAGVAAVTGIITFFMF